MKNIAKIMLFRKLPRQIDCFDYKVPESLQPVIRLGSLVKIPFRAGQVFGVVLELSDNSEFENLKQITSIESSVPLIKAEQLALAKWFANYYHYSLTATVRMMLPEPLKNKVTITLPIVISGDRTIKCSDQSHQLTKKILGDKKNYLSISYDTKFKFELMVDLIEQVDLKLSQIAFIFPHKNSIQQFLRFIPAKFQDTIAVVDSQLFTSKSRYNQIYQSIKDNKKNIIIGTRSALFAPFCNLKIMFVDDIHSDDHINWDQEPRFNALEVARQIQKIYSSQLIFSSPAPKVADFYRAREEKWQLISLGEQWPNSKLKIIDLKDVRRLAFTYLSEKLINEIKTKLVSKFRVLLVINKRGYASFSTCRDCGQIPTCPKCSLPYTLSQSKLYCFYCKQSSDSVTCQKCTGHDFVALGYGQEQLVEEITKLFSKVSIATEADRTPTILITTAGSLTIDIIEKYDFMALVHIDSIFYNPDFNTTERAYDQIQDLIAKYRLYHTEPIFLQTNFRDNLAIRKLGHSYQQYYVNELKSRQRYSYPPFSQLIQIFVQDEKQSVAEHNISRIYNEIAPICLKYKVSCSKPYKFYKNHVRGRIRYYILLKFMPGNIKYEAEILNGVSTDAYIDKTPLNVV
ncbi:hypothetical protein A2223_01140 [Candidatus Falkowbacteria bacterium RIFOXYA2_FULL_35_8]|nr:MAG: hypothetical protein A2223_01140 [Candidatus Falkowbacteria bacterium RIFOXYA2_FULL_35_8]